MATARDKLISDWRERLAAAEAVDTSSDSRPAWLARLQVRLYRFLLSLYGDAEWTTTPRRRASPKSAEEGDSDSVVFDSPTALPLAGKPPKSLGQIQAVLKSVANAQSQAPAVGPLTQGLTGDCWVTVALASAKNYPRIMRLVESLQRRGIVARLQHHGSRYVLEVHASDMREAARIAREPPPRPARPNVAIARKSEPGPLAPYFVHVMVIAAVVGLFTGQLAVIWAATLQIGLNQRDAWFSYRDPLLWMVFFGGWILGATGIVGGANSFDLLFVAGRNLRLPRRMSAADFFAGLGWHCLATGCFLGPLLGLLAVAIAGRFGLHDDAAIFFLAWGLTILAAAVIYVSRTD